MSLVYEMTGPLFFGTAKQVSNILEEAAQDGFVQSVVLIMDSVPVVDVSGALALCSGVEKFLKSPKSVFLIGVRSQPLKLIRHYLPEDSMQALQEVVTTIHDIPSTPNLRWISQRDGLMSVSPGLRFLSRVNSGENTPFGHQQVQSASFMI
jgi:MFS superfamily sulfate permease-like transporter